MHRRSFFKTIVGALAAMELLGVLRCKWSIEAEQDLALLHTLANNGSWPGSATIDPA